MTDEEICAILDKMREEEPDHENCALRIKKEKEKLDKMKNSVSREQQKKQQKSNET